MIKRLIPAAVALVFLGGCGTLPPPQTVAIVTPSYDLRIRAKVINQISDMPPWFTCLPADTARTIYAAASSSAPTAAYAIDKAILNGRRAMAEKTAGTISSTMTDRIDERSDGSVERASSRITIGHADAAVTNSVVLKSQVRPDDAGGYRAYVLVSSSK